MEFYTDIKGPQRMNPSDFDDPRTFTLAQTMTFLLLLKDEMY